MPESPASKPLKMAILRPSPSAAPAGQASSSRIRFLEPEDPNRIEVIESQTEPGLSQTTSDTRPVGEDPKPELSGRTTTDDPKPANSNGPKKESAEDEAERKEWTSIPQKCAYMYMIPLRRRDPNSKRTVKAIEKDIKLDFVQDTKLVGGQRFYRRMFIRKIGSQEPQPVEDEPPAEQEIGQESQTEDNDAPPAPDVKSLQMPQSPGNQSDTGMIKYTFRKLQDSGRSADAPSVVVAENEQDPKDVIAIRIRKALTGYSEWMNELQVCLLPSFRHKNIMSYTETDTNKCRLNMPIRLSHLLETGTKNHYRDKEQEKNRATPVRIEYWMFNNFYQCRTLRNFLRENTITWPQMLSIARGIVDGLNYMHENYEHQNLDKVLAMDGFIYSTNQALKKMYFQENKHSILMKPIPTLTIVHRNLTSTSIVLKQDLTPCIWDFGLAKVHHPFQPTNCIDFIDPGIKNIHTNSPYSAPELLESRGHMSLAAMKSIDMYACGVVYWELISRCVLPKLDVAEEDEQRVRSSPDPYQIPLEDQLGPESNPNMLSFAVAKYKARPTLKREWMIGKKSFKFVQLITELWDQNFDARLQTLSVIGRLEQFSLSDRDYRYRYAYDLGKRFDPVRMWPPDEDDLKAPPYPDTGKPSNKIYEDLIHVIHNKPTPQEMFPSENDSSEAIEEDNSEQRVVMTLDFDVPEKKKRRLKSIRSRTRHRRNLEYNIYGILRHDTTRKGIFEQLSYHGQSALLSELDDYKPEEPNDHDSSDQSMKKVRLESTLEEKEVEDGTEGDNEVEDEPTPSTSRSSQPTDGEQPVRRFILRKKTL